MSKYRITLNGKTYEMDVEAVDATASAPAAAPVAVKEAPKSAAPAPKAASSSAAGAVNSPMPGTILKISVEVGAKVNAGDSVVVLEAMKMENDITAPKSGVVKTIAVNKGDAVAAGQLLFEVE